MATTSLGERYGAGTRAGAVAKVQYPQRSRQSRVRGMKTFGE
jgi:hypothetical protein